MHSPSVAAPAPAGPAFDGLLVQSLDDTGAPFPMWLASLPVAPSAPQLALLSTEERARADRFRTAELRQRYVAGHVALRLLAARHFGTAANANSVVRDARGKLQSAMPATVF